MDNLIHHRQTEATGAIIEFNSQSLHMTNTKISQEDRFRFSNKQNPIEGDPDFSVKKNEAIIARTIKTAEKIEKRKAKEREDGLLERSDLIYSYINHIYGAGGNQDKTIEDYAGREKVMSLLGEQKMREIKERRFIIGHNN